MVNFNKLLYYVSYATQRDCNSNDTLSEGELIFRFFFFLFCFVLPTIRLHFGGILCIDLPMETFALITFFSAIQIVIHFVSVTSYID